MLYSYYNNQYCKIIKVNVLITKVNLLIKVNLLVTKVA